MTYSIFTLAAASATLFAVAANLFPNQLESLGVSGDWIREPQVQRTRRAPVRITQPKSSSDCLNPSFGHAGSLFQVFVRDSFNGSIEGGIVHGRLAVGGDAQLTNWSIGSAIFPQSQGCPTLIEAQIYPYALTTGSSVTMRDGDVVNGYLGVSEAESAPVNDIGEDVVEKLRRRRCGVQKMEEQEFDFTQTQLELESISFSLYGLDQTVRVAVDYSPPVKTIMKLEGKVTEIVYIDAEALMQSKVVAVSSKPVRLTPGITVVINVFGEGPIDMIGTDTSILAFANKVIWNFQEARSLYFEDLDWYGTILAPHAHVEAKSARVLGGIYARSFSGSASIKPPAFDGCLPLGHVPSKLLVRRKRRGFEDATTVTVTKTITVTKSAPCTIGSI
ncbi:hypothetical protein DFJ77DRAFT_451233 [Powellomyces hirtus]|nr:hypothetical protein DFJ77DRAFT_451233 [Powellomyces hirtus]